MRLGSPMTGKFDYHLVESVFCSCQTVSVPSASLAALSFMKNADPGFKAAIPNTAKDRRGIDQGVQASHRCTATDRGIALNVISLHSPFLSHNSMRNVLVTLEPRTFALLFR